MLVIKDYILKCKNTKSYVINHNYFKEILSKFVKIIVAMAFL